MKNTRMRWGAGCLVLLCLLIGVLPATAQQFFQTVSATSTNTAVAFAFPAKSTTILNRASSANEVYFAITSTTATTAGPKLEPGQCIALGPQITGIGLITAAGETATVDVFAFGVGSSAQMDGCGAGASSPVNQAQVGGVAVCKTTNVNSQGVANAGVVVDATAGGVAVLAASATRCGAVLYNLQGGGDALCAPSTVTVTPTRGFYVAAGQSLSLAHESQQAWRCIRQAATNATLYVAESTP